MSPPPTAHFVMNATGGVLPLDVVSLNAVFSNEYRNLYGPCCTATQREQLIRAYITCLSPHGFSILRSADDIPGHSRAPLAPDGARAIVPPAYNAKGATTVYAYEQVGGFVWRYTFTFSSKQQFVGAQRHPLGERIGEMAYLA